MSTWTKAEILSNNRDRILDLAGILLKRSCSMEEYKGCFHKIILFSDGKIKLAISNNKDFDKEYKEKYKDEILFIATINAYLGDLTEQGDVDFMLSVNDYMEYEKWYCEKTSKDILDVTYKDINNWDLVKEWNPKLVNEFSRNDLAYQYKDIYARLSDSIEQTITELYSLK